MVRIIRINGDEELTWDVKKLPGNIFRYQYQGPLPPPSQDKVDRSFLVCVALSEGEDFTTRLIEQALRQSVNKFQST